MPENVKADGAEKKPASSDIKNLGRLIGQDVVPDILPILPLGDVVLFPSMILPLIVNTSRSITLIDDIIATSRYFVAVLQRNRETPDDAVAPDDLYRRGCLARLIKMIKFPDDSLRILVQGVARCALTDFQGHDPYLTAGYTIMKEQKDESIELAALAKNASQQFQDIVSMSPGMPDELKIAIINLEDPGKLADLITSNLNLTLEERQQLLEEHNAKKRLDFLSSRLNRELEVLQLGTKIQNEVSETFSKSQRDFFLREQLKAIRKELGEENQQQVEITEISEKIKQANMPEAVAQVAEKEMKRLNSIPTASPEYAVVRTYLDWLAELPWARQTEDVLDIKAAKKILDQDHYDLTKIKERILEYLAVLQLKKDMKGPILCFAGPPGVGKTSLGQSIARALGRKFIRMSLGGVHDEAEIRGHRRTYIGALPGRVIQGLRTAGTRNPVFMLDEVDKIGADFRGDPSSALLEVLDPEQNFSFSDHYLDVPFDLSNVLFITTANRLDTIPPALRDRMEVLELSGYTRNEKLHIARRFLLKKQIKAHGLKSAQILFPKPALEAIISDYTREAGVRNLEREIANVCRKVAKGVAEGKTGRTEITPVCLRKFLGAPKFESEVAEGKLDAGVATGLAWTPTGGEILFIEATKMPGKGQLVLTGSLGDVMKESARAAISYVRANADTWRLTIDADKLDIHVHVPGGAIPKDGPSAGVAITMALVSLFSGKALDAKLAMTGEITLRGKVMPVGGIKEKVLAAARAGITHVVLPEKNKHDLDEIPPEIKRRLTFKFVRHIDEVIRYGLKIRPTKKKVASP
ncbi:MAG: endopeptidase La [Spartobacteria bacterium]|nr:endopeptidase La [Spartobacteria bacterium]